MQDGFDDARINRSRLSLLVVRLATARFEVMVPTNFLLLQTVLYMSSLNAQIYSAF